MTDSIDLDEMDAGEDEEEGEKPNHGDWLWRGEGEPDGESDPQWNASRSAASTDEDDVPDRSKSADTDASSETSAGESADQQRTPKVPGAPDGPVGVPETQGGAGGGGSSANERSQKPTAEPDHDRTTSHGDAGEADEMTLALTYEAINRLEEPQVVIADARGWADWIGIVGKVSTPAIRKFQRDERIDLDFFGGSETGPAQRLADITPESMFYAERMVVVGSKSDEWIAETAGWEFIPLETAAEKAGWSVEHAE